MKPKILVITPVRHIAGVPEILESAGAVTYLDDPSPGEALASIGECAALFTNPNKSRVFISRELIDAGRVLKAICTASTGTNHIDLEYAAQKGVAVLALTHDHRVIDRISSTAEHAFALMLAALRRVPQAFEAVRRGEWDYQPYIGRQMDHVTVGVVGYGRLGAMFAKYCAAFGARVLAYDPYKNAAAPGVEQVGEPEQLLAEADVISLHAHHTPETQGMVNREWFARMKPGVIIVNTARGELVDEAAAVEFLESHPAACLAADVVADEVRGRTNSRLLAYARAGGNVILTPHIGGMTVEAQQIAYRHAAGKLRDFLSRAG